MLGYHLNDDGTEVDFVAATDRGEHRFVQVCADLGNTETRERELSALATAARETGIDHATVVSLTEEREVIHDGVPLRLVPAWRWLRER